MKRKIPKHNKWRMSYEDRIRGYEQEKTEMFAQIAGLPAEEVQRRHQALIEKWGI